MKLNKMFLSFGTLSIAIALMLSPLLASAEMLTRQLQLGMSGGDVSILQVFLAKDATIYPQGIVSGYFGSLTKSAVSNFQARNGIATVGRVGPATLLVINSQMNGSADKTSPSINSINTSVTDNSSTLSWNTNENSSAVVYYSTSPISMNEGPSVTIGGSSILAHTDMRSSHSVMIPSLSANTTYYYVLYVRDASGNESISWQATFRTN